MNLTKINGCYSKELRESCPTIQLMAKEQTVSLSEMKRIVKAIVEPAFINAGAKKRFLSNVSAAETKAEVSEICRLAVVHGMYYKR